MNVKLMKLISGIGILGIILAMISPYVSLINSSWNDVIGISSTIISIVLGLYSIIYTYVSGQETLKVLEEIKKQNRSLVDKINRELGKDNYDEQNIEYIKDSIRQK